MLSPEAPAQVTHGCAGLQGQGVSWPWHLGEVTWPAELRDGHREAAPAPVDSGAQGLLREGWAHCRPPSPRGPEPLLLQDQAGEVLPCEVLCVQGACRCLRQQFLVTVVVVEGPV